VNDFNWDRYLGIPYLYGGNDPAIGLDCAGICKLAVWGKFGIDIDTGWYYDDNPNHLDITARSINAAIYRCPQLIKSRGEVEEGTILVATDIAADLSFVGIWTGRKILTSISGQKSRFLDLQTVCGLYDLYAYSVVR
jgi:hypothetical protein